MSLMTTNGRARRSSPTGRALAARPGPSSACWRRASNARSASSIRSPKHYMPPPRRWGRRSGPDRQFPAERDAPVLIETRHRLFPRIGKFEADRGIVRIGKADAAAPAAEPEIGARRHGAGVQRDVGIIDEAVKLALGKLAAAQRPQREFAERRIAAVAVDQPVGEGAAERRAADTEPLRRGQR